MALSDRVNLLIQQWKDSPRLRALAAGLADEMQSEFVDALSALQRQGNLEFAEGVWLDAIGTRLNAPRARVTTSGTDFFGFSGGDGVGFDQGIFFTGIEALRNVEPITDHNYRNVLRARGLNVRSHQTIEEQEAVMEAARVPFSGVTVSTGSVVWDVQPEGTRAYNLLRDSGGLPKAAGVDVGVRAVQDAVLISPTSFSGSASMFLNPDDAEGNGWVYSIRLASRPPGDVTVTIEKMGWNMFVTQLSDGEPPHDFNLQPGVGGLLQILQPAPTIVFPRDHWDFPVWIGLWHREDVLSTSGTPVTLVLRHVVSGYNDVVMGPCVDITIS